MKPGGAFTVDQLNSDTITTTGAGNDIIGSYSLVSQGNESYDSVQTIVDQYILTNEGLNTYTRTLTGSTIDQNYSAAQTGSDSFTLIQTFQGWGYVGPFAAVSINGIESYTYQEAGNNASGDMIRLVDSTIAYQETFGDNAYSGTVSYEYAASGNFLVGSLSLSETGNTRYSLLENFDNTASGQNGSAPGNADYLPFAEGFQFGSAPSAPTGGVFAPTGSQLAQVDASTGVVGRTQWQLGSDLSGATQLEAHADYGAALFKKFCFAGGTPLLTPSGHKNIEDFKKGDELLAALDTDARSPVGVQVVEEVFSNHSPILNLHVGGRILRTTAEHPIFAWGRGWVPAGSLQIGDRLRSHDGKVALVEGVAYSGEETEVYNLRVGDWHTYFVGASDWGFSVWSHNTTSEGCDAQVEVDTFLAEEGMTDEAAREQAMELAQEESFDPSSNNAESATTGPAGQTPDVDQAGATGAAESPIAPTPAINWPPAEATGQNNTEVGHVATNDPDGLEVRVQQVIIDTTTSTGVPIKVSRTVGTDPPMPQIQAESGGKGDPTQVCIGESLGGTNAPGGPTTLTFPDRDLPAVLAAGYDPVENHADAQAGDLVVIHNPDGSVLHTANVVEPVVENGSLNAEETMVWTKNGYGVAGEDKLSNVQKQYPGPTEFHRQR